jgi:hypothetical protein
MTHFSESEFVDFAEGVLTAGRSAHLDTCAACRSQAADVRAAFQAATAVDVPEPSPLFWDHLSARIRQEICDVGRGTRDVGSGTRPWWRPAAVAVLGGVAALIVLVAISIRELPRRVGPTAPSKPSPVAATVAPAGTNGEASLDPASTDAAWAVLRAAASDMELDDASAAGLSVRPGVVDKAVLDLTPAERDALGRLLQDALKTSAGTRKTL